MAWVRVWEGFESNPKWRRAVRGLGVPHGLTKGIVTDLLLRAGRAKASGRISDIDIGDLAENNGLEDDVAAAILAGLQKVGFIERDGSGWQILSWEKYQPAREDDSAERNRRYRARKKGNGHDPDPPQPAPDEAQHSVTDRDASRRCVTQRDAPRRNKTRRDAPESESESDKKVDRQTDGPRACARDAPLAEFWNLGLRVLGDGSRGLLDKVLELKGSPERALAALHHAQCARDPWKYLGVVLSDPPFDHAAAKGDQMFASIREAAAREDERRENVVKLRRRED